MIELGLSRIARLLERTPLTWKAIHIAGTNGKGSICAYTSALIKESGIKCGRFTSPHLIIPRDCISINGQTVRKSVFDQHFEKVTRRDQELGIHASEFEVLTATAFEIFNDEDVEIGVVEVGLGGRLDATNVMTNVLVSVISKIGLDHQALLGNTITEIAKEKAGILRPSVPCVVDGTNPPEVKEAICRRASDVGTSVNFVQAADTFAAYPQLALSADRLDLLPHQRVNLSCAVQAFKKALDISQHQVDMTKVLPAIESVTWPGRLQSIDLKLDRIPLRKVLLDGAHNSQSAEVLGNYVDRKLRMPEVDVTWVVGVSSGKNVKDILRLMSRPTDNVVAVPFSPVEGMPWVAPTEPLSIVETAKQVGWFREIESAEDMLQGLRLAAKMSSASTPGIHGPVVVAGSLYLVSDFLRLIGHQT